MRYIIIYLLALLFVCDVFGQVADQKTPVRKYSNNWIRGVGQSYSHAIMKDCFKKHAGAPCAKYAELMMQSDCSHKWVEMHQDTVEVRPIHQALVTTLLYNQSPQQLDYEFESTVQLTCLICHQEKKKVIHYKRD